MYSKWSCVFKSNNMKEVHTNGTGVNRTTTAMKLVLFVLFASFVSNTIFSTLLPEIRTEFVNLMQETGEELPIELLKKKGEEEKVVFAQHFQFVSNAITYSLYHDQIGLFVESIPLEVGTPPPEQIS